MLCKEALVYEAYQAETDRGINARDHGETLLDSPRDHIPSLHTCSEHTKSRIIEAR